MARCSLRAGIDVPRKDRGLHGANQLGVLAVPVAYDVIVGLRQVPWGPPLRLRCAVRDSGEVRRGA